MSLSLHDSEQKTFPAKLIDCSTGADDAGIPSNDLDTLASRGKVSWCSFQYGSKMQ